MYQDLKKKAGVLLVICFFEFWVVTYIIISSPPTPPQIKYFQSQADLQAQARTLVGGYFQSFPQFTRNFLVIFDAAEEACANIYSAKHKTPERAVEEYNYLANTIATIFPKTGLALLLVLAVGMAGSFAIYHAKFLMAAPLTMVISALLVSPPISEILINVGDMFFFYWALPILLGGIYFLYKYWVEWFFDDNRKNAMSPQAAGITSGIALMVFGGLVTLASVAATVALEANRVFVGGPAVIFLYGLYRVIRSLFAQKQSNRSTARAMSQSFKTGIVKKTRSPDIQFDYDFDSNLYMLSKDPDAINWEVTLYLGDNRKERLFPKKFSPYPGCEEHQGEAAWLVEGYRPKKIEILRPGMEPVFIEHPDSKI